MAWVCPSCGFNDNHDSFIRCLCGHEISMDDERKFSKSQGILETELQSASDWTWEHFVAGFLISFFVSFIYYVLFDFSLVGLLITFIICLFIGFLAGLYGGKVISFLFELIRWM